MEGVSVQVEKKNLAVITDVFVGELPSMHTLSYNIPHS